MIPRLEYTIVDWSPETVRQRAMELGEVYRQAFDIDPRNTLQPFVDNALVRHTDYDGYRCVVATDDTGNALGFVYGYESAPGRWWHDTVRPALVERGHAGWLRDAFEYVEFAVVPEVQGNGIGSRLHDTILAQTRCASALLSTNAGPNPARDMYLRRGWIDLVPQFVYPGGNRTAMLMGLDLAAWRQRNGIALPA